MRKRRYYILHFLIFNLSIVLGKHLNFHEHIAKKIKICKKLIGTIKHLPFHLPCKSLQTIYQSFVRPHLDYGDIIYDNPEDETLINKLEKVQYQACLAVTGALHRVRAFTENWGLNVFKLGGGIENDILF